MLKIKANCMSAPVNQVIAAEEDLLGATEECCAIYQDMVSAGIECSEIVDVINDVMLVRDVVKAHGVRAYYYQFDKENKFALTPSATFVWRNRNYGWCFPNFGYNEEGEKINSCLATMVLQLDATYQITDNFGLFAKVAYCSVLDEDMRDAADYASGPAYGKYKDFVWGGVGITVKF